MVAEDDNYAYTTYTFTPAMLPTPSRHLCLHATYAAYAFTPPMLPTPSRHLCRLCLHATYAAYAFTPPTPSHLHTANATYAFMPTLRRQFTYAQPDGDD